LLNFPPKQLRFLRMFVANQDLISAQIFYRPFAFINAAMQL